MDLLLWTSIWESRMSIQGVASGTRPSIRRERQCQVTHTAIHSHIDARTSLPGRYCLEALTRRGRTCGGTCGEFDLRGQGFQGQHHVSTAGHDDTTQSLIGWFYEGRWMFALLWSLGMESHIPTFGGYSGLDSKRNDGQQSIYREC